jgi:thiol-disulfide isomerase/thioredoxin
MSFKPGVIVLLAGLWAGTALAAAGTPAPSCPLPTLDRSRALDPAGLKGKVVYVDFWASWCGPCAESFPFMNRLHREFEAQGLEVIGVNLDEEPEEAEAFLKRTAPEFAIVTDPEAKCPTLYEVKAMPTSYLIDKRGKIRYVHLGFRESDGDTLRREVQALLNEP